MSQNDSKVRAKDSVKEAPVDEMSQMFKNEIEKEMQKMLQELEESKNSGSKCTY